MLNSVMLTNQQSSFHFVYIAGSSRLQTTSSSHCYIAFILYILSPNFQKAVAHVLSNMCKSLHHNVTV